MFIYTVSEIVDVFGVLFFGWKQALHRIKDSDVTFTDCLPCVCML